MAFQATTSEVMTPGDAGLANTHQGSRAGTSPSIATLASGGYLTAFQAKSGMLAVYGPDPETYVDTHLGMMAGTSPAIAASPDGSYEIAIQANNGNLWIYSSSGVGSDTQLGMQADTSPSITALASGGYQVAFQTNIGVVATLGSAGNITTTMGMRPGTSPSIAGSPTGGYQIALAANTGDLYNYDSVGGAMTQGQGMERDTSPAITALSTGGYQTAFQASDGDLVASGVAGEVDTGEDVADRTSPSIAALPDGGYRIAFQADDSRLNTYSSTDGPAATSEDLRDKTSPAIASPPIASPPIATSVPPPTSGRQPPANLSLSAAGAAFIGSFEGFVDHPYDDPVGHCTVGFGHLIHYGNCTLEDQSTWGTLTTDDGLALLQADAETFAANIRAVVPTPLYQHEFDALVSLSYNIGNGGFNGSSVLADLAQSPPAYEAVPDHLLLWTSASGRMLCGLYGRRVSEGNLFATGSYEQLAPPCA
jgi:GH24 family phage-related lysozyme (muramidase)